MTSQAYQTGEAARSAQRRDDRARSRTIPAAKRSTAVTFRNIPAHNAIVIMQTTHTAFHKQRKRDNINNASVMLLCSISRNHGIVILRFGSQVFVTFRNISSAYHFHKPGLLVQAYYSTGVLLCAYAGMRIQRYGDMGICGYAHRRIAPLCVKPHGEILLGA
jgi:hypothetical protein